ncbi:DUF2945 domain-containing protein [Chelatococcus sambhunathii]|uniref:DUF2945 domain-containing protein n=1 Tax=Chelatococcus sambhunathii TaxID=363953 RepID=A0ABU1DC60_9HYPH|nr:DUF2945 domain-containing protein [Chelatococcus sambhunathii]MDR4305696.1 DUF2945 domain-containing protein [Chelatococcus sambhunathii]
MSQPYSVGSTVSWSWGKGTAKGKVAEVFKRRVQRTIKGSKITRNGSEKNPAYLVEQADGDRALKSHSELEKS